MKNLEQYILDNRAAFDTEIPNLRVWATIEKQLAPELNVEAFIEDNRAEFDTEIPNLKIWAHIDKTINKATERRFILRGWLLRAAAAVALLVVGATVGIVLYEKRVDAVAEKQVEQIAPDFQKTEKFYDQQVKAKLTKLASYDNTDPSVFSDLKQIDQIQEELKAELDNAPSSTREEIVRRMIENYKIKIGILERVLEHIEDNPSQNLNSPQSIKQQNDSI
jgi:hypothetical protein